MHILAFSHYYPPEVNAPASRMAEHARAWVALGHRVTVVTCAPNHPAGQLYQGYRNRLFAREVVDGVEVIRLWTFLAANEGFLPRIANYLSFLLSAVLQGWRLPRADVALSTSPQFFCGLTGWFFRRRKRPWVLEIRDLWPESIVAVGAMKRGRAVRAIEAIERAEYRHADLVVSVTDGFIGHIAPHREGRPIAVVKNGADLTRFAAPDVEGAARFAATHGLTGKFVAAYIGTHGMAHGLDALLDAAERLRVRDDIRFLLVGSGAERARLLAERDRRGLANVVMVEQQSKASMPAIWGATDAALIVLRRNNTFSTVLPSKMFEAMALARPIILGIEGEAQALLEDADAGIAVPPEDDAAIAAAVTTLADDHARGAALGERGRAYVRANFDRTRLAAEMATAMQALIAK